MNNPYTTSVIAITQQSETSSPIYVAPPQALGDTMLRFGLCMTWDGAPPSSHHDNSARVYRINSAGALNHIATLTPSRPVLRDLAPDVYLVEKSLTDDAWGVDLTGTGTDAPEVL